MAMQITFRPAPAVKIIEHSDGVTVVDEPVSATGPPESSSSPTTASLWEELTPPLATLSGYLGMAAEALAALSVTDLQTGGLGLYVRF